MFKTKKRRKKLVFIFDLLIRYTCWLLYNDWKWAPFTWNLEQEVYHIVSARILNSIKVYSKIYYAIILQFSPIYKHKNHHMLAQREYHQWIAPGWELSGLIFTMISDKIVQYKYTVYLWIFFPAKRHTLLDKLWCSFFV